MKDFLELLLMFSISVVLMGMAAIMFVLAYKLWKEFKR